MTRDDDLTYGALRTRADALACHLHDSLERGAPVVVLGHKQADLLTCFLACIKSGHPYVPIDTGLPAARIDKIIRHSRAALVLAPAAAPPEIAVVPVLAAADFAATVERHLGERPPASAQLGADDLVYVIYTSGSTGEPKGVQITLANLDGFVTWARTQHPVGGGRRFLNQAPFSFDLSVMDLYLSLTTGGSLYSIDRAMIENPLELRAALVAADVEIWVSTPSFAEMCLADRTFRADHLPGLRCFLFCGEILTPSCAGQLRQRFPAARIYNLYGPTEATVAVTSVLVDDALLARGGALPLGAPRPDTVLHILDPYGQQVQHGERGEIVIEGPCVSRGYLHAPELTARAFSGTLPLRRYRTGDAGHHEGTALMFDGRLDFQVKLFGHCIELDDVAHNLAALPEVEQAVVLPVVRSGRCEALAAFVVLRPGAAATATALRDALGRRVPGYMVPREVRCRDRLPMTVNGKIALPGDRPRLRRGLRSRKHHVPPAQTRPDQERHARDELELLRREPPDLRDRRGDAVPRQATQPARGPRRETGSGPSAVQVRVAGPPRPRRRARARGLGRDLPLRPLRIRRRRCGPRGRSRARPPAGGRGARRRA